MKFNFKIQELEPLQWYKQKLSLQAKISSKIEDTFVFAGFNPYLLNSNLILIV